MILPNLLKSAAGTCRFCRQQAGILSRSHNRVPPGLPGRLERDGQARLRRRQVARVQPECSQGLPGRNSQAFIRRCQHSRTALEEGWRRAVRKAAADGSITHEEEFRLREFRDRLGLNRSRAHASATEQLNLTSQT